MRTCISQNLASFWILHFNQRVSFKDRLHITAGERTETARLQRRLQELEADRALLVGNFEALFSFNPSIILPKLFIFRNIFKRHLYRLD